MGVGAFGETHSTYSVFTAAEVLCKMHHLADRDGVDTPVPHASREEYPDGGAERLSAVSPDALGYVTGHHLVPPAVVS